MEILRYMNNDVVKNICIAQNEEELKELNMFKIDKERRILFWE